MKNQVDEIMQCLIDFDLRRNKRGLVTFTSDIDRNTSGVSPPLSCGDVTTLNWRESAGHNNIDVSDDLPLQSVDMYACFHAEKLALRNHSQKQENHQ